MSITPKYIVVGQGIAGTILAFQLIKAGLQVKVYDSNEAVTSSKVALGVFNPIVFKRLIPSWMAHTLIPYNKNFYEELEVFIGDVFFFPMGIYRPLANEEEIKFWQTRMLQPELHMFLSPIIGSYFEKTLKINKGGWVSKSGFINMDTMLSKFRNYLRKTGSLAEESFDYDSIQENQKVIFCEGFHARNNPYFNWLPFKFAKGEILTIRAPLLEVNKIVSKNFIILPIGNDEYKVGSTYNWDQLNSKPTIEGRAELMEKLNNLISVPYEIINQEAAVRPTTRDRRPFIGQHPEYKNLSIFNGMGTKGLLLAPYFAQQLIEHLEYEKELHPEVDIKRYYAYYQPA